MSPILPRIHYNKFWLAVPFQRSAPAKITNDFPIAKSNADMFFSPKLTRLSASFNRGDHFPLDAGTSRSSEFSFSLTDGPFSFFFPPGFSFS